MTGVENSKAESPPGSPYPGPLPEGEGECIRPLRAIFRLDSRGEIATIPAG